ncbi:hypothetical protein STRIP9103_06268, partial [Streptomyces ipomoeae 91-03]
PLPPSCGRTAVPMTVPGVGSRAVVLLSQLRAIVPPGRWDASRSWGPSHSSEVEMGEGWRGGVSWRRVVQPVPGRQPCRVPFVEVWWQPVCVEVRLAPAQPLAWFSGRAESGV